MPTIPTKREFKMLANDELDPIDVVIDDVSKIEGDIEAEERKISSEFDADDKEVRWNIKVYRVLEKEGKMNWLFNCLPSELPIIDKLRDQYGSGIYRARIYRNGKLYRALDYSIEAPRVSEVKQAMMNDVAPTISATLKMMADMQERHFNKMMEIVNSRANAPVPSFDPVNMMTTLMGAMIQMKTFLAPSSPPSNGTGSMDMLLKGVELAKELAGGGGESNFLDVIRDIVKSDAFSKAIETSAPVPALPSHAPVPQTAPELNPATSPITASESLPVKIPETIIKQYINQLLQRAARNSSPELYAEFVLDNVAGTPYEQQLLAFLSQENAVESLIKINARVTQHREWFQELRDTLVSLLTEDYTSDDTNANATGSAAPEHDSKPAEG